MGCYFCGAQCAVQLLALCSCRELLLSMLGTLKSNLRETVRQQQQSAAGAALSLAPPAMAPVQNVPAGMAPATEPYAFLA
jgi:hypothetical protein